MFISFFALAGLPPVSTYASSKAAKSPVEKELPPDLVAKYNHYRDIYVKRHLYKGGTVEALLDDGTKTRREYVLGLAESQGWTGVTLAAFAFNGDWKLAGKNLSYWKYLAVEPGRYVRYEKMPLDNGDNTSIDQYGKMLIGIAVIARLGPDELKRKSARIVSDIIKYGKAHDWEMGDGPYVDIHDIRFLLQLLCEKLGMKESALDPGETREKARQKFLMQFKQAFFIRNASENYYTLNLYFERMFTAKILDPSLEGLDAAIADWYKIVKNDGDTMFDWFFARVFKKDTSFVIDRLRAFPENPPDMFTKNGYNVSYRWENSPDTIARALPIGQPIEYTGMDFMALASFYSYFKENEF